MDIMDREADNIEKLVHKVDSDESILQDFQLLNQIWAGLTQYFDSYTKAFEALQKFKSNKRVTITVIGNELTKLQNQ